LNIHAIGLKASVHLRAYGILAYPRDEADIGAEARRGNGLIGPLAPGDYAIASAGDGLTGTREVGNLQHMIGIDATQNDEFTHDDSLIRPFSYGLTTPGHREKYFWK
jgi:hypothetical protein